MELDEEEIPVVIEEEQKFEAFAVVQKADDEDDNQLLDYGNAVAEKIETNDSKEKEIYLQVKQ